MTRDLDRRPRHSSREDGPMPGATLLPGGACRFTVWAPERFRVEVHLLADERRVMLRPTVDGYHEAVVEGVTAGTLYRLRADGGRELPDPASRSQPQGVHGPSEVVDPSFAWSADHRWRNPPLDEHVLYELHLGTFSPEGTFQGAVARLDDLVDLGVTAIELMPIAPFAGARGWGYDGVYPWAVHADYGGLRGLQELVDAAHRRGLAVYVDVVHNHLGPEGNYLAEWGPYFTDRYRTPWGAAINFDGPDSDEVRRFFIGSAVQLVEWAHVDGLRLDAVHAIADRSPLTFLEELTASVHEAGRRTERRVDVVAESNANDPRLLVPPEQGGYGMDGQWCDDFHHALVALLTGERDGYYSSYGDVGHLARALRDGFVYTGQYSTFHRRRHGRAPRDLERDRLIVFAQNHDQIGNRMLGDRLATRAGFERAKLAAALVLLSPFVPLLFMGEEHAEPAPFLYFTSHGDLDLAEAVSAGRRREFEAFRWQGKPPEPQAEATFTASRVSWELRARSPHREMLAWYRSLIALRREHRALAAGGEVSVEAPEEGGVLRLYRRASSAGSVAGAVSAVDAGATDGPARLPTAEALIAFNLDAQPWSGALVPSGDAWRLVLDSGEPRYGGAAPSIADPDRGSIRLPPHGVVVYTSGSG